EILYDNISTDAYEWVELYNRTASPIDLSYYRFGNKDHVYYTFPNDTTSIIPANGFLLLTMKRSLLGLMFDVPGETNIHDWNGRFALGNANDTIRLVHPNEYKVNDSITPIASITYGVVSPWPTWAGA